MRESRTIRSQFSPHASRQIRTIIPPVKIENLGSPIRKQELLFSEESERNRVMMTEENVKSDPVSTRRSLLLGDNLLSKGKQAMIKATKNRRDLINKLREGEVMFRLMDTHFLNRS